MKTFNLQTKFGLLYFIVNGINEVYVSNRKKENFKEIYSEILIRNKHHKNLHVRFGIKGGKFDGRTYDLDGNTCVFVSDKTNEYFQARAVSMSEGHIEGFSVMDSSEAARKVIYQEIKDKLNIFYTCHKEEIEQEFVNRAQESKENRKIKLNKEITELEEKLSKLYQELEALNM